MRQALALALLGPVVFGYLLIRGMGDSRASIGSAAIGAAMMATIAALAALLHVVQVRGPGRATIGLIAGAVIAGSLAALALTDMLLLLVLALPMALIVLPWVGIRGTIRVPLAQGRVSVSPGTAARAEVIRTPEGDLAIRHHDGRWIARGADVLRFLQAVAGPLEDHRLLVGAHASEGDPALDPPGLMRWLEATVGERSAGGVPPVVVAQLPVQVWDAVLALDEARLAAR